MKRKHTEKKSANRSIKSASPHSPLGYMNERTRKGYNKMLLTKEKIDRRFTKPKPRRKRKVREHKIK